MDILDGTPLLDIKPYVPKFDAYPASRAGWLDERRDNRKLADDRFHEPESFRCSTASPSVQLALHPPAR